LPLELLVLTDIGSDHLADLAGAQQLAEPLIVDAGIVGDDGQVLDPAVADGVDQPLGNAAQAEAAGADRHAVEQQPVERRGCIGIDFLHVDSLDRPALSLASRVRSSEPESGFKFMQG
jgi:hypothetical protein